jgi:hypothetical protein
MILRKRTVYALGAAIAVLATPAVAASSLTESAPAVVPAISVLSNRADLVSGGDALMRVVLPSGVRPGEVTVTLNGQNVTRQFGVRRTDRAYVGLVSGLKLGRNVVLASVRGERRKAQLVVTNYPSGGPIFAGRQPQPWYCNTEAHGFGKPRNAQCDVAPRFEFFYKSTSPTAASLQPYDVKNPPSDVATTTTDQGVTVPFIVRKETGVIDRGWYQWAFLYDPRKPWTVHNPQPGWNRKLVWGFGGGCGVVHYQGDPVDVFAGGGALGPGAGPSLTAGYDPIAGLAKGFGYAAGSLQVGGNNCNLQISAESLMMQQERIREQYGEIRFSIGTGCSFGSMQQLNMANAYPGLLSGLIPSCTIPEADQALGTNDLIVLSTYFLQKSPHLWANERQQAAVYGQATIGGFTLGGTLFNGLSHSDAGCGAPDGEAPWIYDEQTNPRGTRCSYQDFNIGRFGKRTDGFARRPWANEGVQYGLRALQSGQITPLQFVDLNAKVGAIDINAKPIAARESGVGKDNEKAFGIRYQSSGHNDFRNTDSTPIIDVHGGGSANLEFHSSFMSPLIRERLLKANGNLNNFVLFQHNGGTFVTPPDVSARAFALMDQWLTAVERDRRSVPAAKKVAENRPAGAVDSCWAAGAGEAPITDDQQCRALYPYWGNVETAAGQDISASVIKCQLKPLREADYAAFGVTFNSDQWSQLEQAFPRGVCDYNKRAYGQQPAQAWMTYGNGTGQGAPLGAAPRSTTVH